MSLRRTGALALATAIAVSLVWPSATSVAAVSLADQTAADRAALARAVERYEEAQAQADEIDARVGETSAALDQSISEEERCQSLLRTRAVAMYRSGDGSALSLLLGATTIQELSARLDLLDRMARQDAANLQALKTARLKTRESAEALLDLQAEQARLLDVLAAEVTRAKSDLAASESALREYEAKAAAAAKRAADAAKARNNPNQQLIGSGEWKTGVASHYGLNFSGRGASGEQIGPYSMIVAHRTLPFGTLIEFEYDGKRAVARVADRGPHVAGRDFDLGPGVARVLGFSGVHKVRYRVISQ